MPPAISTALQQTIVALFQAQDPPLSYHEIARRTKTSRRSVQKYLNNAKLIQECSTSPTFAAIKNGIAEKWYRLSYTAIEKIDSEKLEKASARDLAVVAGIAHQHGRLALETPGQVKILAFSVLIQDSYKLDPNRKKVLDITPQGVDIADAKEITEK